MTNSVRTTTECAYTTDSPTAINHREHKSDVLPWR